MILSLFRRSFLTQLRRNFGVSVALFLGMVVSTLCISIVLGRAEGEYRLTTRHNDYASLTVSFLDDPGKTAETLPDTLSQLFGEELLNVLYLAPGENTLYIGWQGYEQQRWLPHVSGRFFTHEEQESSADVVYLSMDMPESKQEKITLDGVTYQVIGVGWIVPFNISCAVSEDAPFTLVPDDNAPEAMTWKVYVHPYQTFFQHHVPAQVLVNFNQATMAELKEYQAMLQSALPDAQVDLPPENSDLVLSQEQRSSGIAGLILALIAGITMIQLMREWVAFYRQELYVYYLCGLPRASCRGLIYGQWFLYYLVAAGLALLLHRAMFPLVQAFRADYLPRPGAYLCVLLLLMLLTVAYSWRTVRSCLDMTKRGEVT